jgi:hypothetical protein
LGHYAEDARRSSLLPKRAVRGRRTRFSGIYSYYSGQFLTPLWTGPDPTGTAFTTSRTPANVTIRPDHLRDANLPADERSVNRWFDLGAFSAPQPGNCGTAVKGTIMGPDVNVWHAGIYKNFALSERPGYAGRSLEPTC